jgi:hypothetical protein
VRAALDGPEALAAALGAVVPAGWPPQFLDAPALEFTLARLDAGLEQAGWWMYSSSSGDGASHARRQRG